MIEAVVPAHLFRYAGAMVHVYHANRGQGIPRHIHEHSHATFCTSGACVVRKEGFERVLTKADAPIDLKPNEWHEIEAVEDKTVIINVFRELRP